MTVTPNQPYYRVEQIARFLHDFPHIDFKFESVNSSFDLQRNDYKESIIFLAAIPVAFCVLVFLLTFACLCFHCCCKDRPTKRHKTTCTRCVLGLFIILAIGSIAVGFFGNEEGNKGVQSTIDAIQNTNDTLSGSLDTLKALDGIADNITSIWVDALKQVINDHLKTNVTVQNEVLKLVEDIRSHSSQVRGDLQDIQNKVNKINLDPILEKTGQAENYRWIGTISMLCWEMLVLVVYIIASLKKSKYCIIWGLAPGVMSLLLAWASTGVYLGGSVAVSDFCMNPDAFIISQLEQKVSPAVIQSYVQCKNQTDPQTFSQALRDALMYVQKANETLDDILSKTAKYNISKYLEAPVRALREGLREANANVISLSNTVYCGQIHTNYVKALHGICNRALVGMSLVLLVLPILGLSLMFVQCLAPRIWLLLSRQKEIKEVDVRDPFLPRPPNYNGYGTITEERTPLQSPPDFRNDGDIMTRSARSVSDDSPPPAFDEIDLPYYPGSFVEQYSRLGTFPQTERRNY
ncbi:protein tweety homolog 1-A-like isoform X2 [Dreissena polymorpha]|uniref:Protein tweety homolog n=1 Tax=Dreissena polymorpha TaxID=45954 RepID=A0A9D4LRJ9_DREPO|nr:protein tweety homolog 1-A-like isoform X2 [Dreissena polymorpha]KAH3861581.1 hypothetical protein DPMN_024513 [Dreissena polymorpha]